MLSLQSKQVKIIYDMLLEQECYELLDLIMRVVNGKLKGKRIICKTPFHKNPAIHCIMEILFTDCGIKIVKLPKENSTWKWPTIEPVEKITKIFCKNYED